MTNQTPVPVSLVLDPGDDAAHTHAALAAHAPAAGRITLHPSPGTKSTTALAHDLLAALGKPVLIPGRYPSNRQPAWEAATAWIQAAPLTQLTVLRAHRLTRSRLERLLHLCCHTGTPLTLVCHRPHVPAALQQALRGTPHVLVRDFDTARDHYYGGLTAAQDAHRSAHAQDVPQRWITLPALDRLVSYDSPSPCPAGCSPPPIHWRRIRPPPRPLTKATATEVTRRIHTTTSHPRLAAALAAALFTGASFQQLATAHTPDFNDNAATLALHDRTRYTDGCATHPVPPWAGTFLRAAACFAHLTADHLLLAHSHDRRSLLRLAEQAKLRPPQPPTAKRIAPKGVIEWTWRERKEAGRYDAVLAAHRPRSAVPQE